MHLFSSFVAFDTFFSGSLCMLTHHVKAAHFHFDALVADATGLGKYLPHGGGKRQSPIDIVTSEVGERLSTSQHVFSRPNSTKAWAMVASHSPTVDATRRVCRIRARACRSISSRMGAHVRSNALISPCNVSLTLQHCKQRTTLASRCCARYSFAGVLNR